MIDTAKPRLILDEFRCRKNIQRMVQKAQKLKMELRPHFKTHQSHRIGRWFRELGIQGITVSSADMASYFASDGWKDITIAFPFFPLQIPALKKLEKQTSLRLFINRAEDIELLTRHLVNPFKIIIEIDCGYGRSGVHFTDLTRIKKLIRTCEISETCNFHGFYIHDGRTYQSKSVDQILESSQVAVDTLSRLKENFPDASLMMGDTPSASVRDEFGPVSELSPGNFVFYDWMQVRIGSCSIDDVALFSILPLAQTIQNGKKAIVLGGAVHLSKEHLIVNGSSSFGQAVEIVNGTIQEIEGTYLSALSQEHGTLNILDRPVTGDHSVMICPIHSCLTANLHDHYSTTTGNIIEKRILS